MLLTLSNVFDSGCWVLFISSAIVLAAQFVIVVQELLKTQTALRNLVQRNRDLPVEALAARNQEAQKGPTALQLPFILIQVSKYISKGFYCMSVLQ